MHSIDFNSAVEGKRQAAFVIIYARDGKPWSDYVPTDERKAKRTHLTIPTCLCMNRCDGQIGFIGGGVEHGESLEQAARREVLEEIGYSITTDLREIVAHDIGPVTTHAFATEVSYDELREIQRTCLDADHFGSEVTGVFLPHLIDYDTALGKGGGIVPFLQHSFAPSVREELIHFLLKINLFEKEALADICTRANFNLDELLR
jgi:U8 snoRNA-decapping enzyme